MTTKTDHLENEALQVIADMIQNRYPTSIAFMHTDQNCLYVDWVDDTTTEYAIEVSRHVDRTYHLTRDA